MRPFFTIVLVMILTASPLKAAEILVIGDSWSFPVGFQLKIVLSNQGHADSIVSFPEPSWGVACDLSSAEGRGQLSSWLNLYPDSEFVHFSLGGNDILNNWTPALAGLADEDLLVEEIVDCMGIIVDHILAIRPQIQVVWSSYDYLRPIQLGSPAQINAVFDKLAAAAAEFAQTRGAQVHTVNIVGTLQKTYGFDGVQHTSFDPPNPIPPGDPSLPNPALPSPFPAFPPNDPTHPIVTANRYLATAQYEKLYQFLVAEQDFQINPGLNGNWWNGVDRNGEGAQIEVADGGEGSMIFVATFYSYDPMGNQIFLVAVGSVSGNSAEVDVFITDGGVWGDDFNPALVNQDQFGTGTFTAISCESVSMALMPNAAYQALGYTNLEYGLIRLTTPAIPCPYN